ncbi:MAG: glutamine-hydrolyzing carbamoyl-phosphate synthase small subunit [Chloroflexi bacterium]|nr:glutamine-hydrolyzing carbamoyl-phosphate synthase small subunit [Chloroflexota bacterium]
MKSDAYLVLEDGSVFAGEPFGAPGTAVGEVVFNTSMTGYQEILTDPSYAGQMVVATYPLIGNYGINDQDVESERVQVAGYVVRHHARHPSHCHSASTVDAYLASQGVPGLSGVDTRAITRKLRSQGVMMGCLTTELTPEEAGERLRQAPRYGAVDYVQAVSTKARYEWDGTGGAGGRDDAYHIVVTDCGLKYNILRHLRARGCRVTAVPVSTSAQAILALRPHGVLFSPGPGDPALLGYAVEVVRGLLGRTPVFGICLGHQLLARALGAQTFKLKFGHRGGNHPVQDVATGRVSITAQNHGYAVDPKTLPPELEVSHVNLNDGTVEGIAHRQLPVMGIQFHSEAAPGPWDNEYLFDRFLSMVKEVTRS